MPVKRWAGRKIIIAPGGAGSNDPKKEEPSAIVKKLAQAYRLMKMIENGKYPTWIMLTEAKKHFLELISCSFDQGFWSPENQEKLQAIIAMPALRKKGRKSQADRERQESVEFQCAAQGHAYVESAINALENHGLDRSGISRFWMRNGNAGNALARNVPEKLRTD